MADINSLADVIEKMQIENGVKLDAQVTHLASMETYLQDILGTLAPQTDLLEQIAAALAPDAFGAAQATETNRETSDGAPIISGPADNSQVAVDTKKPTSKLAMLGVAAAGAAAGLVAAFAGFLDFDAQKVKDKVLTLTSINEVVSLGDINKTVYALTTLGGGLAIFGVGSGIAGLSEALVNFTGGSGFVDSIVENVKKLAGLGADISIADAFTAAFALGTIGGGLAIFGVGSAVAGLAGALNNFMDPKWAVTIVDNVKELVKVADIDFTKAVKFAANMALISTGLVIFGVGAAVGGLGAALANFTDPTWAKSIVDNVTTLVTVGDIDFSKVVDFAANMGLISAGLVAFGIGSTVAGVGAAIAKFTGGSDWSQTTVDNVKNLLTIPSLPGSTPAEVERFKTVMSGLSDGLMSFGGGNLVASLANAGAKIVNFLTGSESPITEMMNVASKADDLTKGATALERIESALSKLSGLKFDGGDINIKDMADDLVGAVPAIEKAIMGGKAEGGFFKKLFGGESIEFKGLASGEINFEEASKNIKMLRDSLGLVAPEPAVPITTAGAMTGPPNTQLVADGVVVTKSGNNLQTAQAENNELTTLEMLANQQKPSVTQINSSNTSNANTTTVATNNVHHKTDLTLLTNVDF